MYYVCEQKQNLYGVVDTDDGICEFYRKKDLIEIAKQVNILGVTGDKVEVVDKNFVMAKAKLLGVSIKNTDYLKYETLYKIHRVSGDVMYLEDIESGNSISIKGYPRHIDLLLSRKLKVVNLLNNRYFSSEYMNISDNMNSVGAVVYLDGQFMILESCLLTIRRAIRKDLNYEEPSFKEVYRLSTSKMLIKCEVYAGNIIYYEVNLSIGRRLIRRVNQDTAVNMLHKSNVMAIRDN